MATALAINPRRRKLVEAVEAAKRAEDEISDAMENIRVLLGLPDSCPLDMLYLVRMDAHRSPVDPEVRRHYERLARAQAIIDEGITARMQLHRSPPEWIADAKRALQKQSKGLEANRVELCERRDRLWESTHSTDKGVAARALEELAGVQEELQSLERLRGELIAEMARLGERSLELDPQPK